MKNAIIIHGWPDKDEFFDPTTSSPSNNQWLPWLQKQLSMQEYAVQTPEMPHAYEPQYQLWKETFEQYRLSEETVLVGHSCGGGFLVRWLSEHPVAVRKVILVAPWIDPMQELGPDNDFFSFTIDPTIVQRTTQGITIFSSTDDEQTFQESVTRIHAAIPESVLQSFENAGHFCIEDGFSEFPTLLEEIIRDDVAA